jgi:ribokinase|tara:strand:- start:4218 stop:5120 length:903 start_codon:yes stop_codon:yes gene_type:complete
MKKFEVVCFGSAIIDAFLKVDLKEENKNLLIRSGSKILMKELHFDVGGGGANTSVAFSRLGLKTGYIGKTGDDKHADRILSLLKKERIKFLGEKIKGNTDGFSVILESKRLNRSIMTYKGINDEIDYKKIKKFKTKWLYLSSMMKKSFQAQIKLAKKLKGKKTKIAFNPSEYLIRNVNLKPLIKLCDVLILNKEEADLLTKEKDKLKGISKMGPKIVVITNEGKTVYCYNSCEGKIYSVNPRKTTVVEKTGAGDAFASGFVAGLIKNKSIKYCLNLGLRESQAVIQHVGAQNNLIRMKLK